MITRDNYQEFFLLYIDNELSAADRLVVEEWVAANPDRQEEWESLLFCRIAPEEEVVFRDKKTLLRTAGDIEADNYADYLDREQYATPVAHPIRRLVFRIRRVFIKIKDARGSSSCICSLPRLA